METLHSSSYNAIPQKPEGATRILLVRHCEAEGNTNGRFQGSSDCGISGNGEKQLELLALRLRNIRIDAMYSSPLKRAWLTAEAVNRYHHLPIHAEKRLQEIDGGDYEGLLWADLPKVTPIGIPRRRIFARPMGRACARSMTAYGKRCVPLCAKIRERRSVWRPTAVPSGTSSAMR